MLFGQPIQGHSQVFVRLYHLLLQSLDQVDRGIQLLRVLQLLDLNLEVLDTFLEHLVLLVKSITRFDFGLLEGHFFLLLLDDVAHLFHVVLPSNKPDFFEATPSNLQVLLVVTICLGKVVNLLQQDVRNDLHIVGLGVLAHQEEGVCEGSWLARPTNSRDGRMEATHAESIGLPLHGVRLHRVHHRWHLHVLLFAVTENFAVIRDLKFDLL